MSEKNYDEMTDEEFANATPPEESQEEIPVEEQEKVDVSQEQEETIEETEQTEKEESGSVSEEQSEEPQIDYKGFYTAVMSPIKANGKDFQARSPEEAIKLMQMGANYTQKMQTIAPYRKKIQMLQNAGLLDDDKLNYLIDLSQGNKEAVKKLLKDSKLDPLDLDIDNESAYIPGNHTVSDSEVQLQSIVDDLKSTPQGLETLRLIQGWDQASLNEIWKSPSMVTTLNEQRQNGVYDFIVKEMEHQKMLGNIPEGTSFLDAYKAVGDYCLQAQQQYYAMQQQQATQNLPTGTLNKNQPTPSNVRGAAPSGRSRKATQQFVDPFSLSDEEFEKQFKNYS